MKAVVNVPICPLLAEPHCHSQRVDEALFGMTVEVLDRTTAEHWRVRTPYRYEGYARADDLAVGGQVDGAWTEWPKRVVLHKNYCDVVCEPSVRARCVVTLPLGAVVAVDAEARDGWQRVLLPGGSGGYVRESWLDVYRAEPVELPERALRERLAETAMRYARAPYRWGGKTPQGIDCSGLVSMAYLLNGITVCRDARMEPGFALVEIDPEAMDVGDAIFFPGHVAMYLGAGRYIHATGHAGSDGVAVNSLDPAHPDYRSDLAGSVTQVGSYVGFHR